MCVSTHEHLAVVCVLLSEGAGVDLNVSLSLYEALHPITYHHKSHRQL